MKRNCETIYLGNSEYLTPSINLDFSFQSYFFISNTVASYACAYILSLLVEGPTVGLEKVLLGKVKSSLNKKDK